MFDFLDSEIKISDENSILDIGGNDGTLLEIFLGKKSNLDVLNIDASSNLTKISQEKGIPTINEFWGAKVALGLDKNLILLHQLTYFSTLHQYWTMWKEFQ